MCPRRALVPLPTASALAGRGAQRVHVPLLKLALPCCMQKCWHFRCHAPNLSQVPQHPGVPREPFKGVAGLPRRVCTVCCANMGHEINLGIPNRLALGFLSALQQNNHPIIFPLSKIEQKLRAGVFQLVPLVLERMEVLSLERLRSTDLEKSNIFQGCLECNNGCLAISAGFLESIFSPCKLFLAPI